MNDLQRQRIEDLIQEVCAISHMPASVVRGYVDAALSVLAVSPDLRSYAEGVLGKAVAVLRGMSE